MLVSSFIAVILLAIVIFKIYLKVTISWCRSQTCLVGKTVIVTGANSGIGFETAIDFAKRGAKVILACRDENRAETARLQIIDQTDNSNVFVKIVDMSSFESVRAFAKNINETEDRLDILVNNAAVWLQDQEKTKDGYYINMQVNYLCMFLLTTLLLSLMETSGASRIINVSSILAKYATPFDLGELSTECLSNIRLYKDTKMCMNLFTKELARRVENTGITTYSLHPGVVKTPIFKHLTGARVVYHQIAQAWFLKTCEEGAQTTICCAVEKRIEHLSGQHFVYCHRVADYKTCSDLKIAKKVWDITEQIVDLTEQEEVRFAGNSKDE